MPATLPPLSVRNQAVSLLAEVRRHFEAAVHRAAALCTVDGRLDGAALDARQWICHELALACADLLAAETVLQATADNTALDQGLALAFATEAIGAVLARLDGVALDSGADPQPLQALQGSAALTALRRAAAGADTWAALGRAVADTSDEIGAVALDEPVAMAQAAFRRFAAEVVAPVAEAIHRQDLTVPESLLQPMREMGVFGLSIPERFGGSAPDGHDDTLLMVAVTEALSEASLAAAGSLITRPEILARALMAGGTDAQKDHWLPRLAAGQPLCAISITEPDHGSDVAGLTLKATPVDGGWRLSGAKTWCTFAGKAGVLMVVARTDPDRRLGHRGLSLMLVEKPAYEGHAFDFVQPGGGRLTGRAIATIGYRGMHSFDLSFQDLFVPHSHVIGEQAGLGRGFYLTMAGMMGGRHADRRPRLGRDARRAEGGRAVRERPARVRRAAHRLPAHADQDRPHGCALRRLPGSWPTRWAG